MTTRDQHLKELERLEQFKMEVKQLAAETLLAQVEFWGTARHAVVEIEREQLRIQRGLGRLQQELRS